MAVFDNVIAYYKLDEASGNPVDSSGGGYNLTNVNTATFSAGKLNNGANFVSASSQQFTIPSGLPDLNSNTAFSFSFWIKTSSTGAQFISTRCDGSAFAQWNIMANPTSGRILFEISPANSSANRMSVKNTTGNVINDGSWHHVVITKNATRLTSGVKIYIDGTSATIVDDTTNTLSSDAPTGTAGAIGSRTTTFGSYFDGSLDEFGIWNRELTSGEVTSLYNSGSGLSYAVNITVSAPVKSIVASIPSYTVVTDVTVAPSVKSIVASIPTYTVIATDVIIPMSVKSIVASIPAYTVRTDVTSTLTEKSVVASIPSYTVRTDYTATPAVKALTFSIPTYSETGDANVALAVKSMTFSIPAYTVLGNCIVSLSPLSAVVSIPDLVIRGKIWSEKFSSNHGGLSWSDKHSGNHGGLTWGNKY